MVVKKIGLSMETGTSSEFCRSQRLAAFPMLVVANFAPDVFIVMVVCTALLYLTGILKLARWIFTRWHHDGCGQRNPA